MGRLVTLADLAPAPAGALSRADITGGETSQLAADLITLGAGATWADTVPAGSDCYLFAVSGSGMLDALGRTVPLPQQAFATIRQGTAFRFISGADPVQVIRVIAPPNAGAAGTLAGYADGVTVAERPGIPFVEIPEQKKRRQYITGPHGAKTERSHAMIVTYVGDTLTGMHHHPDAESMFVLLDGALDFVVNGETVRVSPGQVTYFKMNDPHALRPAPGVEHVAFLEFHVPAAFSTVKHAA